jgi:hypothetical protein
MRTKAKLLTILLLCGSSVAARGQGPAPQQPTPAQQPPVAPQPQPVQPSPPGANTKSAPLLTL